MEKYSKKLVSKCIYIQILKCTETDLLGQFMAAGGWNLVHNWLSDGVKYSNLAFIQELLEMLLLCPVDGNRLKSNHTPKIVKNLSISCEQQTVKILSLKLVEQWLRIAHQEKQLLAAAALNNGTEEKPPVDEIKAEVGIKANGTEKAAESKSEDENTVKKSSSENIKYKVNNKESSGKLLLTLKRSTSPSIDEKDSKVSRTSNESKSKSSSSSKSSTSDKEKEKKSGGSSSSSSSSHRSSSKSSHKDKERSSSHHKSSSSKDKHSSSSSRSSSSKPSSSRDKDRKKESNDKEKSQAEKDKETLDFLTPMPSAKLQRIPKRQHSDNSENKSAESNDASPTNKVVEKKKPSISIEVRKGDKPKTVKTLNSQFRNHGLAEEPPKPPSRKDLKKPSTPAAVASVAPTAVKSPISPPPAKKIHLDTMNVPEREGGVKLIKPKRKYHDDLTWSVSLQAAPNVLRMVLIF